MATDVKALEAAVTDLQGQVSQLVQLQLAAMATPAAPQPNMPQRLEPTPVDDHGRFESGAAFVQNGILWTPTVLTPDNTVVSGSGKTIPGGRSDGRFVYGGFEWRHGTNVYRKNPMHVSQEKPAA